MGGELKLRREEENCILLEMLTSQFISTGQRCAMGRSIYVSALVTNKKSYLKSLIDKPRTL
jgi:hypothetical protein